MRGPEASAEESFDQKIIRVCDELHLDPDFKREIELVMEKVMDTVQKDVRLGNIVRMIHEHNPQVSYFAKNLQLTSIISCFLAKAMEWHSKTTLDKPGWRYVGRHKSHTLAIVGLEFTKLMTFTMRFTRCKSSPQAALSVPSKSMATLLAASLPVSVSMLVPN
jgi:hypothetical protein